MHGLAAVGDFQCAQFSRPPAACVGIRIAVRPFMGIRGPTLGQAAGEPFVARIVSDVSAPTAGGLSLGDVPVFAFLRQPRSQEFAGSRICRRRGPTPGQAPAEPLPDISGANSKGDCHSVTVPVFATAAVSRICGFKNLQAPRSHSGTGSKCQSLIFPAPTAGGLSFGDRLRLCGRRGANRDRQLRSQSWPGQSRAHPIVGDWPLRACPHVGPRP